MCTKIKGVLCAIVTPFSPDGGFSPERMRRQVERQILSNNAVFCGGTNGEFFALTIAERIAAVEVCVEAVAGRVPVVAHIGEISSTAAIELGRTCTRIGVNAVAAITPWFAKLSQSALVEHFTRIADAVPAPVYLYNMPKSTGNQIEPNTAALLGRHPNIAGIKDSAGTWESIEGFLDAASTLKDFDVLVGPDHLVQKGLSAGCIGCVSGLANVVPQWIAAVAKSVAAGDMSGAQRMQDAVADIRAKLYSIGFGPAVIKAALNLMAQDVGECRYITAFTAAQLDSIKTLLEQHQLLGG